MFQKSTAFSSFSTNDIEQAMDFYSNILGLEVLESDMGLLQIHTAGNNPIIIYPRKNHVPASFTVLNFSVSNIESIVNQLIEKGITFEQYDAPIKTDDKGICWSENGPNIAWFKDPAGNILSILEDKQ